MQQRKHLPIGIENFPEIILDGYKYVDKTEYIHRLCTEGKPYFLSRPRRFGKSLLLSTIECLYQGRKELFKGLWIEERWDWTQTHPVLRFSMKDIGLKTLPLQEAIVQLLDTQAERVGISLSKKGIAPRFAELLEKICGQQGPVVVLIDEYDAPILDFLGVDEEKAKEHRDLLREFYTVLKGADIFIKRVLLTGVSKFSRVGVFSGLNNLRELSLTEEYACLLGYTQEELEANFALELQEAANDMGLGMPELLEQVRKHYNGYRFHQKGASVYNPFSIMNFLADREFNHYWFESGTPTFLIHLLREKGLYELGDIRASRGVIMAGFEVERLEHVPLLYQTGYLSIQGFESKTNRFVLGFPNEEVREAFVERLLQAYTRKDHQQVETLSFDLVAAFEQHDLTAVERTIHTLFAGIPYDLTHHSPEAFYHATLHLLFSYIGVAVQSEVHVSTGRIDTVVETATHIYILEYKLNQPLQTALSQIREKQYPEKYRGTGKSLVGIGLCFSSQTHNLEAFGWEGV